MNEHGVGAPTSRALAVGTPDAKTAQTLAKAGRHRREDAARAVADHPGRRARLARPAAAARVARSSRRSPAAAIVVAAFGEGAEALLFRAPSGVATLAGQPGVGAAIERKLPLPTYEKYLKFRRMIGQDETPVELISNVLQARELQQDTRLYGTRCGGCGLVQYPMARVCLQCKGREGLEPVKLKKKGMIFTYTVDHLAANLDHPMGMVVVDLEGGGRLYLQMTDCTPEDVKIGAPVELTYRRLHAGGENYNYFWKARPL